MSTKSCLKLFLFFVIILICSTNVKSNVLVDTNVTFDEYIARFKFDIGPNFNKRDDFLFRSDNSSEPADDEFLNRNIDDLFVAYDGSEITVTNLKITGDPSPRLTKSTPNMMYAFLDTAFEWSTVIVDGSFEFYKNAGSPDSEYFGGKLRLMWINTKADGKIAFRPVDGGDVFLSSNYDLNFTSNSFKLLLLDEEKNRKSNQIVYSASTPIRKRVESDVFRRLRENLRQIVDKTLTAKSMLQMFGGNAEMVSKYRSFIHENEVLANKFTDEALALIHKKLNETGLWKMSTPNISRKFTQNFGLLSAAGQVTLKNGSAQNISTLYRNSNFSLTLVDNINITLSGYLSFKNLSAYYKRYEAKFWNFAPIGEILATAHDSEIFIKFFGKKGSNGGSGFQLDRYNLNVHVNHITVETNGISFLFNWLESLLTTSIANCVKDRVTSDIEKNLKPILNTMIHRKPK